MKKSIYDQLEDVKDSYKEARVNFYNTGSTNRDNRSLVEVLDSKSFEHEANTIMSTLLNSANSYTFRNKFDEVSMNMLMGIVYNVEDVENNTIKEGAEPLNGIVRYYTCYVRGSLNDKETCKTNLYSTHGYIDYNKFIEYLKENNLEFDGPESFDELKQTILAKEPFDINIGASFKKEKELVKRR